MKIEQRCHCSHLHGPTLRRDGRRHQFLRSGHEKDLFSIPAPPGLESARDGHLSHASRAGKWSDIDFALAGVRSRKGHESTVWRKLAEVSINPVNHENRLAVAE
jgi:hypothetical protein